MSTNIQKTILAFNKRFYKVFDKTALGHAFIDVLHLVIHPSGNIAGVIGLDDHGQLCSFLDDDYDEDFNINYSCHPKDLLNKNFV